MTRSSLLVLLVAACGDNTVVVAPDAAPDAPSVAENGIATCGKPVVFLNFTGVTITEAASDDAARDEGINFGFTAEPVADPAVVATARADVFARLAALGIPAVTTRPAGGDYTMVVFDDDPSDWPGNPPPSIATIDCGDLNKRNVQRINIPGHTQFGGTSRIEHSVLFTLAIGAGLDVVAAGVDADNCLIASDLLDECAFSSSVTTTGNACGSTTQDQLALLAAAYGCAP